MDRAVASEQALVQACRAGDRDALQTVLRAELPALERMVSRLVVFRSDVDDIVQDTLVTAIRAFPAFRGDAAISTWLCGIAVNVVRHHLRQPAQRSRVPLHLVPAAQEPADPGPSPHGIAEGRRRIERLREHLALLGTERRIAFVLHVVDGRPVEEVARLVGASRVATKSRIFWARRTLMERVRRDPILRELVEEGS